MWLLNGLLSNWHCVDEVGSGAAFSSVGGGGVPCTEDLSRPGALSVSLPLSLILLPVNSSSDLSINAKKILKFFFFLNVVLPLVNSYAGQEPALSTVMLILTSGVKIIAAVVHQPGKTSCNETSEASDLNWAEGAQDVPMEKLCNC